MTDRKLDRRLHAYRPDLADVKLKDQIDAARYVKGSDHVISSPSAPIHKKPDATSEMESEGLLGEELQVFEIKDGWSWGQLQSDGYVGYVPSECLIAKADAIQTTHQIIVPRSFVYPENELRKPPICALSMGCKVLVEGEVENRGNLYNLVQLPNGQRGAMIPRHLAPIDALIEDWVSLAEQFLHTPYLWGGRTSIGLDCSALVQISRLVAGYATPRDSDMQHEIGQEIEIKPKFDGLQRGDLIGWPGHVAIMINESDIIHSNGLTMTISVEPLIEAEARIASYYAPIKTIRRLLRPEIL